MPRGCGEGYVHTKTYEVSEVLQGVIAELPIARSPLQRYKLGDRSSLSGAAKIYRVPDSDENISVAAFGYDIVDSVQLRAASRRLDKSEDAGDPRLVRILLPYITTFSSTDDVNDAEHVEDTSAIPADGFCGIGAVKLLAEYKGTCETFGYKKHHLTWKSKDERDKFIQSVLKSITEVEVRKSLKPGDRFQWNLHEKLRGMLSATKFVDEEYYLSPAEVEQCLQALGISNVYFWQWEEKTRRYGPQIPLITADEYR